MATSRLFPELDLARTPQERDEVYQAASGKVHRRWQFWVYVVVAPSVVVVSLVLGVHMLRRALPWLPEFKTWMVGVVAGVVLPLTYNFAFRRPLRTLIRKELLARRVPVCVKCGYDLRGQETSRCPECGVESPPDSVAQRLETTEDSAE